MTRFLVAVALASLTTAVPRISSAAADKYAITAEEHAACDGDAVNLCSQVQQNEDSLLACMKVKREQLSTTCKVVFAAGLRRRHIPF